MAELGRLFTVSHDQAEGAETAAHPELNLAQFWDDAPVVAHLAVPLKRRVACLVRISLPTDGQVPDRPPVMAAHGSERADTGRLSFFLFQLYLRLHVWSFRQRNVLQLYLHIIGYFVSTERRLVLDGGLQLYFLAWLLLSFLFWLFKWI